MNADARAKRLTELRDELAASYAFLIAVLAALPIPMLLPERQADDPALVLRSLSLAWDLADEEPIGNNASGRIRDMITAWTTAYELAVAADEAGPAIWRLRGIEIQLARVKSMARTAKRHLEGRTGTGLPEPE